MLRDGRGILLHSLEDSWQFFLIWGILICSQDCSFRILSGVSGKREGGGEEGDSFMDLWNSF